MKITTMTAILAALAMTVIVAATPDPGPKKCPDDVKVSWMSYAEAMAKAKKDNLPVVIVFHKDHCRECELLREKSFARHDNACYVNARLAPALVNGEKEDDVRAEYSVSAAPTVWFLKPDGTKLDFFVGYVPADRLALILHYVGERAYESKTFDEYLKDHPAP